MKRIGFLMVALLLMGGMAMAQGSPRGGRGSDDRQVDPKTRAERITERMAKEYSLNDDQKKQLMGATLAMMEQMKRPAKSFDEMTSGKTCAVCQAADSCTCKKADEKRGKRGKAQASTMTKEKREKMNQDIKVIYDAYDAQLKTILTPEQYDAYTKKKAEDIKRVEERRRNRG